MAPLSPVEVFLIVGGVVFSLGGITAHYRSSMTKYHIPLLVLVFLAVTIGLTGVVGAGEIILDEGNNNFGEGFAVMLYLGFGSIGMVVLLFASVLSSAFNSLKLPTSILAGLASAVGLAVNGITQLAPLAGAVVLVGLLTWAVLRVIEKSSHERFSKRMEA